jgi:MarR family transcriptional regulator, organic hydroperoxide resistance regulator
MEYSTTNWLGPLIKRAYRNMTNLHDQKLLEYNLTTSQVGVLSLLWEKNGQTQKELAEKIGIRAASLTGIVDGMEKRGWLIRKIDSNDARIKRLFLTQEGFELEEICLKVVLEMEELLKSGFTEDELLILRKWLKRLYHNVNN